MSMKEPHPLNAPGIRPMLAAAGFSSQQVGNWICRESVPVEHCAEIERVTKGLVTRQALRPNDFKRIWPELTEQSDLVAISETSAGFPT